jgi:general secretion pathway protein D
VGLNLDFKPKVYPNQDVQVSMTIESKDQQAGPDPLTPIFTQRKIEGVARIPNGKTMLIASIAQDRERSGRQGLPLVGLIPILGRLFTTPTKSNDNSDIVITMTPRVLRAPEITPADLEPKDTGTMQTPQSPSLEALIRDAEREEQFARMRALPTNVTAQLPTPAAPVTPTLNGAEEAVTFVPAPKALAQAEPAVSNNAGAQAVNVSLGETAKPAPAVERPAANNTTAAANAESPADLLLMTDKQELKVGERGRVMVFLKTDAPLGLATATLRFDPTALAVRSVAQGGLAGGKAGAPVVTQSVDPSGVLVVSVAPAAGAPALTGEGLLLVIEVEGLAPGETGLQFDADKVHLVATDGRTVRPRTTPGRFNVTQ